MTASARPIDVKEGQKVLYAKYAGTEFKVDGEELLIVSQKDILADRRGLASGRCAPPSALGRRIQSPLRSSTNRVSSRREPHIG